VVGRLDRSDGTPLVGIFTDEGTYFEDDRRTVLEPEQFNVVHRFNPGVTNTLKFLVTFLSSDQKYIRL